MVRLYPNRDRPEGVNCMAGIARGLIESTIVLLPQLHPSLEGLKIAHISDLHIRRPRPRHRRIADSLELMQIDLVLLTGDYMDRPGDERASLSVMTRICEKIKPRLGFFGVFGNHDSLGLRPLFKDKLPVHWLEDSCVRPSGAGLEIIGFNTSLLRRPDAIATLDAMASQDKQSRPNTAPPADQRPLRLLLSHLPTFLPTAADMGIDLMFSGHTHGGQCRLPGRRALYNSTDLPLRLSSGILRHQDTLCLVSRGLGEAWLPLRTFCPPHLPVYTLRRGPMPGQPSSGIVNVTPW